MAGKGPAPKDPAKRARTNKSALAVQPIVPKLSKQPKLPGGIEKWPQRTVKWWKMWGNSPQSVYFMDSDWEFLLETALLHAKFWAGETQLAGELRLRVAKFGATIEDRARLQMQFANLAEAVEKNSTTQTARDRRGPLKATPDIVKVVD
jgi:hypothetical protein